MDRYIFVLGSNWQLSLAELDNCLKYSQLKGRIIDYSANIAVVEFENLHLEKHYINKLMEFQFLLGGCQKIAKIFEFIDLPTIHEAFPLTIEKFKLIDKIRKKISTDLSSVLDKVFPRIKKKSLFYAVSIYPNFYDEEYYKSILTKHFLPFLNKEIMAILKQKGAEKALYYKYPEKNIIEGNLNPIFPHHLIKYGLFNEDRAEIIFGFTEDGVYIARTYTSDDPSFKKKIDEQRPFKEFKSSISPKLAIMMLNFLNIFENREEKRILDPFVGNGTIFLFAMIQDFQVYGTDVDATKIENSIKNSNWLLEELEENIPLLLNERFKIVDIKNLSNILENEFFDGICTEPYLGPFLNKKPYYIETQHLIDTELEPLYEATFREAFKVLKQKGRICIIAPIISTIDGGNVQININKIALNNNFKVIPMIDPKRIINKMNDKLQFRNLNNLIDAKKNQILFRKIYVFEKQ